MYALTFGLAASFHPKFPSRICKTAGRNAGTCTTSMTVDRVALFLPNPYTKESQWQVENGIQFWPDGSHHKHPTTTLFCIDKCFVKIKTDNLQVHMELSKACRPCNGTHSLHSIGHIKLLNSQMGLQVQRPSQQTPLMTTTMIGTCPKPRAVRGVFCIIL